MVKFKWRMEFLFDDENVGITEKYYKKFPKSKKINVPFTYETKLSGIGDEKEHNVIWYNRTIKVTKDNLKNKVLLHFEGSDYITEVWINGNYIGKNVGGYFRFSFDIENYLVDGDNNLTVRIQDSLSKSQPRGKQRYKSESFKCWYVQTTGIWKTVWLEFVPKHYLIDIKNTPNYDDNSVNLIINTNVDFQEFVNHLYEMEVEIYFNGECVNKYREKLESNNQELNMKIHKDGSNAKKWSVMDPNLYDIKYVLYENGKVIDKVNSYFGVRKIEIKNSKIFLNGQELYQRLILDQGYWRDSHLTPPNVNALIRDVDAIISYGYNGVRKHQKNEDERFLYWCDKKGLLVWSEMANCYEFTHESIEEFSKEWLNVVKQNYNHPSIITWVPINESWGVPNIHISKRNKIL